jgi:hypothetical protein
MTEDTEPGVESKANTKFIKRIAQLLDRWDLVKAEV